MEVLRKQRYLIVFYFSILSLLLLCVGITPLLIRHGISLTDHLIIEEEVVEVALIFTLYGISLFTLLQVVKRIKVYRRKTEAATEERSKLVARLAEAFQYIGEVNVEIHEIESALCGVAYYPQNRREFRHLVHALATRAMTIAAVPWLTVRMIERHNGQTVCEHAVQYPGNNPPAATMGNRAVLDGKRVQGLLMIGPRQRNLDLLTVFILPDTELSREKTILLTAILNQIEMLFILHRAGCIKPKCGIRSGRNTAETRGQVLSSTGNYP